MKISVTPPGGEPEEFAFTSAEQASTAAMFALQRTTNKIMPQELLRLNEAGDALTLLYYTAYLILWQAGRRTALDDLYECDLATVEEPSDQAVEEPAEEDPTTAPSASDRGESVEA